MVKMKIKMEMKMEINMEIRVVIVAESNLELISDEIHRTRGVDSKSKLNIYHP